MKNDAMFTFQQVVKSLNDNPIIILSKGGPYRFLEIKSTNINGSTFQRAIHYHISDRNSKRVTFELIEAVGNYFQRNGHLPSRSEMTELFAFEVSSRPCNFSVACSIAQRFIN